jgi:hypothetical protein
MIVMEAGRGVRDHKLSYYDLLECWIGQPFRLARSGTQSGKDATSDISPANAIAAEMKRYREEISLNSRELSGELLEAATTLPGLDL